MSKDKRQPRADRPVRAADARHQRPYGPQTPSRGEQLSGAAGAANRPTLADRQAAAGNFNEPLRGNHYGRNRRRTGKQSLLGSLVRQASGLLDANDGDLVKTAKQAHKVVGKALDGVEAAQKHHRGGGVKGAVRTAKHVAADMLADSALEAISSAPNPSRRGGLWRGKFARGRAYAQTRSEMKGRGKKAKADTTGTPAEQRQRVYDAGDPSHARRQIKKRSVQLAHRPVARTLGVAGAIVDAPINAGDKWFVRPFRRRMVESARRQGHQAIEASAQPKGKKKKK